MNYSSVCPVCNGTGVFYGNGVKTVDLDENLATMFGYDKDAIGYPVEVPDDDEHICPLCLANCEIDALNAQLAERDELIIAAENVIEYAIIKNVPMDNFERWIELHTQWQQQ